jgi:hypothetical protein
MPSKDAAATITIDNLVPGFQFYRRASGFQQLLLSVKAQVDATALICARFDSRLTDLS